MMTYVTSPSRRPIVLHAPEPTLEDRAREALSAAGPISAVRSWDEFLELGAAALCAVAVTTDVRADHALDQLLAFVMASPDVPLVVVMRRDADELREIASVSVDEVVWIENITRHLASAVARAEMAAGRRRGGTRAYLRRTADQLRVSPDLARPLRRALERALNAEVPFSSVTMLARAAGCDRRTLWEAWRAALDGSSSPGLKEFLRWLTLLHALELRSGGMTWGAVAKQLLGSTEALRNAARSLMDTDLQGLDRAGQAALIETFEQRVLNPLGVDGARTNPGEFGHSAT